MKRKHLLCSGSLKHNSSSGCGPGVGKVWRMSQILPQILPPALVNKVLLEHGHTYSFTYRLWWLSRYKSRAVVTETVRPTGPKIFTVWLFPEKACQPLVLTKTYNDPCARELNQF